MSYPYDYLFKLIIIGNAGTGKTSLCRKYVENVTTPYYDTTIGVEFFSKILTAISISLVVLIPDEMNIFFPDNEIFSIRGRLVISPDAIL